jgi:hypothetical protein
MTLKAGWLDRQFEKVNEEVNEWPEWMRKEAGFSDTETEKVERSPKVNQAASGSGAPTERGT